MKSWLDRSDLESNDEAAEKAADKVQAQMDATPPTKKVSARAHIRARLEGGATDTVKGFAYTAHTTVANAGTILSDLKNPKYAGKAGPLNIVKEGTMFSIPE